MLREQNLTTTISNREHVRVEGWTLCGTMLGVFPVCVWTKQLDNGWEARVEARTLSGAVVGAAEAECLRSENTWKNRDDYALRSMAQTRATSKALRQPLGFVVSLAGFDPTPAEEMPRDDAQPLRRQEKNELVQPRSWAKVTELVSAYDEATHDTFFKFAESARLLQFGTTDKKKMTADEKAAELKTAADAAVVLRNTHDPSEFPPPNTDDIRLVWTKALGGQELAMPGEE